MVKEIISLSFGEYSNYVSTHFWNINLELSKNTDLELESAIYYNDYNNPRALLFDSSENFRPYYSKNEKLEEDTENCIYKELQTDK
jgi:hypothetical protein